MNTQTGNPITLSDKCIWIIDDDIPIQAADFKKDDMENGDRPIDRGTLLSLLGKEGEWTDHAVLELCKELSTKAKELKGFVSPIGAIIHLREGAIAPDVIIFDMDYKTMKDINKVLENLEIILKGCISVIQIYTKEGIETIAPYLATFAAKYANRLQLPQPKEITAEKLEEIISGKLESSLSAHLATNIRRLSTIAIENVLVKIDDLPLDVAIKLLGGEEVDVTNDAELVELLSNKVSSHLKTSSEIANAVKEFAQKLGVSAETEKQFIGEVVELLASSVRANIQYEKKLYADIQSAKESPKKVQDSKENTDRIIREFFAYRVYDRPGDEIVRTGDIIKFDNVEEGDYPYLYLVLTPPCELAHFWKKTRGILTLVKMHPLTAGKGIDRIKSYGNKYGENSSITSKSPFILPSIIVDNRSFKDYGLFFNEIESRKLDEPGLLARMTSQQVDKLRTHKQLTYTVLQQLRENTKRECRVSEPFLSGILAEISRLMFRTGVLDFPPQEAARLTDDIKKLSKTTQ
jgi:hypothetical protein